MDKDKIILTGGVFLTLLIVGLSAISFVFYKDLGKVVKQTEVPKPLATVEPTLVPLESYKNSKITILNASGINGSAGKLKDKLELLGYANIEIGNSPIVEGNRLTAPKELHIFANDLKQSGFSEYKFEISDEVKVVIGK